MPLGLESWEQQVRGGRPSSMVIYEPRLQAQLSVDHFRLPPTVEEIPQQPEMVDARYAVPAVRFPRWHECSKCHRIGTEGNPFQVAGDGNRLQCVACHKFTNPVRFVISCDLGHITDFPWVWWAHRTRKEGACPNPVLELRSKGESASLADLYIQCRTCKVPVSLGNAFGAESLKGLPCSGARPWLLDRQQCDHQPRVLQRGASNIHFPAIASALSIPPVSEPLAQILDEHWEVIRSIPRDALAPSLQGIAGVNGVSVENLVAAFERRRAIDAESGLRTDADSRAEEYLALSETQEDMAIGDFLTQFVNRVQEPPSELALWFDLIGAVSRLREVRALVGFSRIQPYSIGVERAADAIQSGRIAPLSKGPVPWLPAAEIRGEGIFLRFRTEAIEHWITSNEAVSAQSTLIDGLAERMAIDRGIRRDYQITPRLLLVHSFAHALIRQLAIECGYSSSALRERLYIAEPGPGKPAMNGVLIYTGSPDSEGSLGGLVRLASPSLISRLVGQAVKNAMWCGSDPVCLESDPRHSGERLGGAACHCCLLAPETACEKYNRELDRTMMVGSPAHTWRGFFDPVESGGN